MKKVILFFVCGLFLLGCRNQNQEGTENTQENETPAAEEQVEDSTAIAITPISHATAVITWNGSTIYTDPVGGATAFEGQEEPDLVLITDIHGDHLNVKTLQGLVLDGAAVIVPQAVQEKLTDSLKQFTTVMNNGETITKKGFTIKAIPMYNLREEAKKFHSKGRGNGYILEKDGKRIYIAGDTGPIPEMKSLGNIDIAFIPMNLPYTMSVEDAAEAVLAFAPDKVYPYHYRSSDGLADVEKFKELVTKGNPEIKVVLLDWYPNSSE